MNFAKMSTFMPSWRTLLVVLVLRKREEAGTATGLRASGPDVLNS
jgi:hypothetical protein